MKPCSSYEKLKREMLIFVVVFIILPFLIGCPSGSMDSNVRMVKSSKLAAWPNKTIGEAVDSFFQNPKWSSGSSEDGRVFVNAKGSFLYMEKKVTGILQFKFNKDKTSFEVFALEINDLPQNMLMINALLEKMFID